MKKKNRLDRGLDSLFSDNFSEPSADEQQSEQISEIRISLIEPNSSQPRDVFDEEKLAALSENIKENGILQPILVRPLENGSYQIVAGERRWRAARMAGLKTVPVYIRELDDEKTAQLALIENLHREDLNPVEEAQAYQRLIKEYKMTQDQLAKLAGKSRSAIANSLRILNLTEKIQKMLVEGSLTAGHAKALAGIDDSNRADALAQEAAEKGYSVRELERLAGQEQNKKSSPIPKELSVRKPMPFLKEFESAVKSNSSVKAKTKATSDGGATVTLSFSKDADITDALTQLAELLTHY
ncbi:MAG: ParB/RepB/Spo0J family partition protein [Ruminococcus sp.]|nr:ParB/RepB/Spo0J family partition protein [Ruminococcus sp.]